MVPLACPFDKAILERVAVRSVAIPHYKCPTCWTILAGVGADLQPCADPAEHVVGWSEHFALHPASTSGIIPGPGARGML